ncbi:hypothetical protein [Fodinicurvata sp. EGI_FJ10296]|uniref:hypothetical protein n=1 Tax=Fodinicurvata sp. EGI_FJ10296 TaxID=3231908 RepID=UPI0034562553
MDPRRELASAAGLLALGVVLILLLGAPRFPGMDWIGSSLTFLVGLAVVPLISLALDMLMNRS